MKQKTFLPGQNRVWGKNTLNKTQFWTQNSGEINKILAQDRVKLKKALPLFCHDSAARRIFRLKAFFSGSTIKNSRVFRGLNSSRIRSCKKNPRIVCGAPISPPRTRSMILREKKPVPTEPMLSSQRIQFAYPTTS
ncbi:MAG: hypothetical protein ACR2K1_04275 [Saprospiraceae bacterium]